TKPSSLYSLVLIQEKRRLQEEQDKVRREKEDERLRQQQLKRKSLRDQWLMEGNPLSPLSPNTQNTFSSLWGTQEQDMEKPADRLQSEDQQVTAQKDYEMEALKEAETKAENIYNFSENGDSTALRNKPAADEVKVNQNTPQGETRVILTNGGGSSEDISSHTVSGHSETSTIEPAGTTKDASNAEMESEMSATATPLSQVPNVDMNEEEGEEDGTLVIRAECVYITDEGDDVSGDLSSLKDQQESTQNPEGVQEIDNQNTEAESGEQEALLQKIPSPDLNVELAGPNSLPYSETRSASKASQGEKSETPKQQSCQCCSV
ncbi:hypothetical protein CCH79_00012438, partial [Gambusia affinis]